MSSYYVVKYLKFFFVGVVAGHYLRQFHLLIAHPLAVVIILVCYAASVVFSTYTWSVVFSSLFSLIGVLALFSLSHRCNRFFCSASPLTQWFTRVGRFSLEVYLL